MLQFSCHDFFGLRETCIITAIIKKWRILSCKPWVKRCSFQNSKCITITRAFVILKLKHQIILWGSAVFAALKREDIVFSIISENIKSWYRTIWHFWLPMYLNRGRQNLCFLFLRTLWTVISVLWTPISSCVKTHKHQQGDTEGKILTSN